MNKNPKARRFSPIGASRAVVFIAGVSVVAASCTTSSATPTTTPTAIVLTPSYAKSAGFPKTLRAATTSPITSQKGCTSTAGAVYENPATQTALISSILNCDSATSASSAFTLIHKHYGADAAIAVPKGLGTSAFASASIAPQYLIAWHRGSRIAITAVDVNIAASSSTSSTVPSPPITTAQEMTLYQAAQAQNALLK